MEPNLKKLVFAVPLLASLVMLINGGSCKNEMEPLPILSKYWKQSAADTLPVVPFDTSTYHLSNGALTIIFPPSSYPFSAILYQNIPNGTYTVTFEVDSSSPRDIYYTMCFAVQGGTWTNVLNSGVKKISGTVTNGKLEICLMCEKKGYPIVALLSNFQIVNYKP
jgi:hypothetical protein